ncbi:putative AP-2 complex subunit beta [Glarea lozoyensis 74030]|uniref:Putative AP-2 complex subunit beta n=1 Tax=Glarea lozoyensis (strain ATCC 74030 / MF5533) TaxID=1104152 RepID=H0ERY4_GLAL7|nr:putative AP-2 complex subunit beta [Glarea lozoyensis 74030]
MSSGGGDAKLFARVLLVPGQLCPHETGSCVESTANSGRVRALALRTMSYIHVREFVEATVPPTKQLLRDADPYVRKTAAFCVAKLYDHDKHLVEASDLIDRLNAMLRDDNPTVVASALASLMDIWERSDAIKLTIDYGNASKMVQILPDCSEPKADIAAMSKALATFEKNIDEVLTELREYATEIDVHFVRKSVRAIGKLAIKIEPAARQCINTLLELVATKVTYIVQEATVVIRNIFRKYPNQYESIISTLYEPEAKSAMIWVIGQYASRIENSDVLLEDFLYSFADEPVEVQLALLTATVKLFIQRPTKGQELVPKVLKWATEDTDNPDLRDRGYMYWRLLSSDMETAKAVVMGEKPAITAESEKLDPVTLEEMCLNVGTLATVYLKPVQQVFRSARPRKLIDSPALQKHTLPTANGLDGQKSLSTFGMEGQPAVRPQGNGDLAAAVDAADEFFAGVGNQQMAHMNINGQDDGFGGSPTVGRGDMQYVVNQNAPEQAYHPTSGQGANGDLLMMPEAIGNLGSVVD